MPGIVIKEIDRTEAESFQENDNYVLIPGPAAADSGIVQGEAYELRTYAQLKAFIGGGSDQPATNVSYHMAKQLLNLGMRVWYVVTDSLSARASSDAVSFFEPFKDRARFNLRFITAGGFAVDADLANEMIECASRRGDATALINVPKANSDTAEHIIAWLDTLDNKPFSVGEIEETPLKYASAWAGTFTFDDDKKLQVEYPAYFYYLGCFAYYTRNYADWYAMAGAVRGKWPYGKVTTSTSFGDADIAILQTRDLDTNDKGHCSCNVIANIRPYGNIVWGNRTLHPIVKDEETQTAGLRASNFLNIRNLCSDIKKVVYRACRRFTFEPNTDTLWVRFCNEITPLLDRMKADQGIRGYRLIQQSTPKKAVLKAIIRIIPVEAIEDFDITVELADSIEIGE